MSGMVLANVSAVRIGGRVLLIEGAPGAGKSSLALALIDRGAELVGDDAVSVAIEGAALVASPPPNTAGLIEVRHVGIVEMPATSGPVALVIVLDSAAPRYPMDVATRDIAGVAIPALPFATGDTIAALRAEHALARHGLPLPNPTQKA